MKLAKGGDYLKKGYSYQIQLHFPLIWIRQKTQCITGGNYHSTVFDLQTLFSLTSNKNYFNIDIKILGFGLGLEVRSRS